MHGYELHQRMSTELGFVWQISQSQAYAILSRLEKKGDVHGDTVSQLGSPAKYPLRLTSQGKQRFTEWLYLPSTCTPRHIRMEFITKLYFLSRINNGYLAQAIQSQRRVTQDRLHAITQSLQEMAPDDIFYRLSLSMRVRQLRSILEWLHDCESAFGQ